MIQMSGQQYEPKEFIDEVLRIFDDPIVNDRDRTYAIDCVTEWVAEMDSEQIKQWLGYLQGVVNRHSASLLQRWILVIANFTNSGSTEFAAAATESIAWIIEHDASFSALSMPMAFDFEGLGAQKLEAVWINQLLFAERRRGNLLQNALEFFKGRDGRNDIINEIQSQLVSNERAINFLTAARG